MHEPIASFRKVEQSSNRRFGLAFGGIFLSFALWPRIFHGMSTRWLLLIIATAFAAIALFFPNWLKPLNQAWFKFGLLLNKIVNPIFMGLMFYGVIMPLAWFLRGKDLLRLKLDREAETYWISRDPLGPATASLTKQF
jgi:hypothetical protein